MKKTLVLALVAMFAFPLGIIGTNHTNAANEQCVVPQFEKFEGNPVLQARKQGVDGKKFFDSTAVTDPCVIYAEGKYHMFYTGWHTWIGGKGSQGYIGYAISSDGKNFTRVDGSAGGTEAPGAVLQPGETDKFDGLSVYAPEVIYVDGVYYMFYVGADQQGKTSIGLARSKTPIYWTKIGQVLSPSKQENSFDSFNVGACTVIKDDNSWKMWFEGQSKQDSRWRIGYATSYGAAGNPTSWTKVNGQVSGGAVLDISDKVTQFDHLCVRNPSVVKEGNCYLMWYDTSMRDQKESKIGVAVSTNGISWEKRGIALDLGKIGDFDSQRVCGPSVAKIGLVYKLYYSNYSDQNSGIGLATTGDMPLNVGSGTFKADCKMGDGFDFSMGNKTNDPTLADLMFDCGYGNPRMCGRFIKMDTDFENAECVPSDGYPAITSIREKCQEIKVGDTYAFKTINEQNYAKAKITAMWQDPLDPTHWEITVKWMYQANGSNCFIAGSGDPPSKPYNLSCVAGDMTIKLSWTCAFAPPGKEIRYYIYRGEEPNKAKDNMMPIHDFPVGECEFTDTGLENGKTYYYVVRSIDQFGNLSEASNECFCTPQAVHPPPFPMPPAPGIKGEGTVTDPFVVEENPFTFDWCGFPPQSMVIIQGKQYIADGNGCIHISLDLKDGLNAIEYTVITPTGEVFNDTVYFEIKDTCMYIRMTIGDKILHVNDGEIMSDTAPFIRNSRTYLPMRVICEEGLKSEPVQWDATQRKVTIIWNCGSEVLNKIEMWIGKTTYMVNGTMLSLEVPPIIENSRTCLPIRFVAEPIGATVGWIDATKTATIDYCPPANCP
ncbi:MAG TPA: stalk domain-containing protein [Caldisericia bacterium]|nr:stalk domain-containing protein [Caldisericia bacterium]HPF49195.1 stalk domain-containing protein [Caldisericia bacterium]HPI84126.1 stalk domain-containing protein [Caldisericia bacterium]HPQ93383.1 stalk domain-containing protein [Caldisericia bacterium]HRV75235.1 stalk domain-containing protein [Caldisericia bacterium]